MRVMCLEGIFVQGGEWVQREMRGLVGLGLKKTLHLPCIQTPHFGVVDVSSPISHLPSIKGKP